MAKILDTYWQLAIALTVAASSFTVAGVIKIRRLVFELPETVDFSKMSDYVDSMVYAVLFALLRAAFDRVFQEQIYAEVKKNDPDNFDLKKKKVLKEGFCVLWYSSISIVGLAFFAGTPVLPTACHGSLPCTDILRDWLLTPVSWRIRSYFMMQFGFHFYTMVAYVIKNREERVPEYYEMLYHHILAVILIFMSYGVSFFTHGITVLLISDLTDSFVSLTKFTRDMKIGAKFQVPTLAFFALVITWAYYRLYAFSFCMIRGLIIICENSLGRNSTAFNPLAGKVIVEVAPYMVVKTVLISLLVVLNTYWYIMILKIAVNRIFKGDSNFTNKAHGEKAREVGDRKVQEKKDE